MRAPSPLSSGARSAVPVAVLAGSHLAVDTLGGGFAALLPSAAERLDLSGSASGGLLALYSIAALASQPVMGGLADRFTAGRVTAVTAVLATLALSAMAATTTLGALAVVIVVGGLLSAAFHPAGAVAARRAGRSRPEAAVAWFSAAGTAGLAIGPVVALALTDGMGRGPLWILVLPTAVMAVFVWRSSRNAPPVVPVAREPRAWRTLVRGPVPRLAAAATLVAITTTTITGTLPLWIADGPRASATDPAIGWALGTFSLAAAAGGVLGGLLTARIPVARLLPLLLVAGAVPILGLARLEPGSVAALLALATAGILLGPVIPVLLVTAQDVAPDRAAAASGMIMGLSYGLAGVAFAGIGVVIDVAGHATAVALGATTLVPAAIVVRRELAGRGSVLRPAADLVCECVCAVQLSRVMAHG